MNVLFFSEMTVSPGSRGGHTVFTSSSLPPRAGSPSPIITPRLWADTLTVALRPLACTRR